MKSLPGHRPPPPRWYPNNESLLHRPWTVRSCCRYSYRIHARSVGVCTVHAKLSLSLLEPSPSFPGVCVWPRMRFYACIHLLIWVPSMACIPTTSITTTTTTATCPSGWVNRLHQKYEAFVCLLSNEQTLRDFNRETAARTLAKGWNQVMEEPHVYDGAQLEPAGRYTTTALGVDPKGVEEGDRATKTTMYFQWRRRLSGCDRWAWI